MIVVLHVYINVKVCYVVVVVVFGSQKCKQCSNWWLWTLSFYVAFGHLLILLFYALKLSFSNGTLNGNIFCTQAIANLLRNK